MKEITNIIKHSTKGELYEFDENEKIIKTQVVKKNSTEQDEVNLNDMMNDIIGFCKVNIDKNIELKCEIKIVE